MEGPIFKYTDQNDCASQNRLIWAVHEQIIATIPHCSCTTKWKVPFYTYLKDLCYINRYKKYIYISFLQGQLMSEHSKLIKDGTKLVAKYYIKNEQECIENAFFEILLDAVVLQDSLYRKK